MIKKSFFIVFFLSLLFLIGSCVDKSSKYEDCGEWVELKNGEECDGYLKIDNQIYGLYLSDFNDYHYFDPLVEVDPTSFEVCKGSGYAKDQKYVYYPLTTTCEDGEEFSGCYFVDYIIKNADPNSFKYIGNGYAIDKKNMYYNGKVIPWDNRHLSSHRLD